MIKEKIRIGIAYSPHKPKKSRTNENVSEETSEQTAIDIQTVLQQAGYYAIVLPFHEKILHFIDNIKNNQINVIINLCEGFWGQAQFESHIAAFFELMKWPFTGNPANVLAICQNKFRTKAILNAYGLPIAAGMLANKEISPDGLRFPLIVKPNEEDASLGVYPESVVYNKSELNAQIQKVVHQYHQPALVEEFIYGREFNVAVFDDQEPRALPVSEIDFSNMPQGTPHICSYQAKWFENHVFYQGTVPICPARINKTLEKKLQSLAVAAFKAMGCRDYARVDFRLSNEGKIYILEVNPNPDISLNAGYVRGLRAAGIEYLDFWLILIDKALGRSKES